MLTRAEKMKLANYVVACSTNDDYVDRQCGVSRKDQHAPIAPSESRYDVDVYRNVLRRLDTMR